MKKKNKKLTFAEQAKKIKNKYGKRVEQGDSTAISSMEEELDYLFTKQEEKKANQKRQEVLQQLEQNPEMIDQISQSMGEGSMGMPVEQPQQEPQMFRKGGRIKYGGGGKLTGTAGTARKGQKATNIPNFYGNVTEEQAAAWREANMPFLEQHGLEKIDPTNPKDITAFQNKWNETFPENPVNVDGKFGEQMVSTTVSQGYGKSNPNTGENVSADSTANTGIEADTGLPTSDTKTIHSDGKAMGALDYAQYATALGTTAAQMANTRKPNPNIAYLDPGLDPLPEYYDQDTRNQIRSSGGATRRAMGDSNTQGRTNTNLIASQVAESKAVGQLGQQESAMNYQTETARQRYNAGVRGQNADRLTEREIWDRQDEAAYEDQMNTYIGNLGNNTMGIMRDTQNRQAVSRMFPNYNPDGTVKDSVVRETGNADRTNLTGNNTDGFNVIESSIDAIDPQLLEDIYTYLPQQSRFMYGGRLRRVKNKNK